MPAEQHFCVPPCIFVPDRELDPLTDSHFKLNSLDNMQELLNISNHKIAVEYDEDTTSLAIDPTLTTVETLSSNNSFFLLGMQPALLSIIAMKLRLVNLDYYRGPKIMIQKQ